MAVVAFDSTAFLAQYAEFTGIGAGSATTCFGLATLYCDNSDLSIVTNITKRTTLLWLLTAHILKLNYGANDGAGNVVPPAGIVGRVEVAKEGTVDVRADMGPPSASAAWYNQTQYGAMYWAATINYRTLRYVPFSQTPMNQQGATPAIWPWGRWS